MSGAAIAARRVPPDEVAGPMEGCSDPAGSSGGGATTKAFKGLITRLGHDLEKAGGQVALGIQKALDETHRGLHKVAQVSEGVVWMGP